MEFLKKISHATTGCIDQQNSSFLFFTIVQSLVKKVNEAEPAKTAVLRIMEAFSGGDKKDDDAEEKPAVK